MNAPASDLILTSTRDRVATLTMNMPARLNGWTVPMLAALQAALERAAGDPDVGAVILTGADPYYCAGVNLSAAVQPSHPRTLHAFIIERNQALFDMFIDFPKPILIAANGPAIGACVTSATLCDGIIASEEATFSTPFAALGVTPEGCSSVHFPRLIGSSAERMLGPEGWKPTAAEALEIGLVQWVVPHESLLERAQEIAAGWLAEGRARSYRAGATREELKEINATESIELATAFLSPPFLKGQYEFLKRKKKWGPAATFWALWRSQPLWSKLI